jgi:hypothetical protein
MRFCFAPSLLYNDTLLGLRRARAVGRLVLGQLGIAMSVSCPVPHPTDPPSESCWRVARDVMRAAFYLCFRVTGRTFTLWVHPYRRPRVAD